MKFKAPLAACAVLVAFSVGHLVWSEVKDIATLKTDVATDLADNVLQQISAEDVRNSVLDAIDSVRQGTVTTLTTAISGTDTLITHPTLDELVRVNEYVMVEPYTGDAELVKVTAIGANSVTVSPAFQQAHSVGDRLMIIRPGEQVTPELWGAVGDGVADDTTQVRAALASPIKRVMLQPGSTYLLSQNLPFVGGNELHGPGSLKATDVLDHFITGVTADNVVVDGVTFIGDAGGPTSSVCFFDTCNNVKIRGIVATDAGGDGLRLDTCTDVQIDDVRIENASSTAAAMARTSLRSVLFEATGSFNTISAVSAACKIQGCTAVNVDGIHIDSCRRTGLYIKDSTIVDVQNIVTQAGHIDDDPDPMAPNSQIDDAAIVIHGSQNGVCSGVRISGGRIMESGLYGIVTAEDLPVALTPYGTHLHDILIEKLLIQHNLVDDRSDTTSSWGININGGADITIQNNHIKYTGQTGIHDASIGVIRCKILNNKCEGCGQNDFTSGAVHWDGIGMSGGYGHVIRGNTCVDNYRNGIQLKPSFIEGNGFNSEEPLRDVIISQNILENNSRSGDGFFNLQIVREEGNYQHAERITISENIFKSKPTNTFLRNLSLVHGSAHVHVVGNHFGITYAKPDIIVSGTHNATFMGNFFASGVKSGNSYILSITDSDPTQPNQRPINMLYNDFQGVDVSELNKINLALAVQHSPTDPNGPGTLADALAEASVQETYDVRLYNYEGGTTGGAAVVRDISELRDDDKALSAIRLQDTSKIRLQGNYYDPQTFDFGDAFLWFTDQYGVEPLQLLTSRKSPLGTGPDWALTDNIYVANGFSHVYAFEGNDTLDLADIEGMLRIGWSSVNSFPDTTDHPAVVGVDADGAGTMNLEAYPILTTAP